MSLKTFLLIIAGLVMVFFTPEARAQEIPSTAICREGYLWETEAHYTARRFISIDGRNGVPCEELPIQPSHAPVVDQDVTVNVIVKPEDYDSRPNYGSWRLRGSHWNNYFSGLYWRIDPSTGRARRAYREGYRDGRRDEERNTRRDYWRDNDRDWSRDHSRRPNYRGHRDRPDGNDRPWYRSRDRRDRDFREYERRVDRNPGDESRSYSRRAYRDRGGSRSGSRPWYGQRHRR